MFGWIFGKDKKSEEIKKMDDAEQNKRDAEHARNQRLKRLRGGDTEDPA